MCVIVCQHVAQHLTEALIATTNRDYDVAGRITQRLHLYATPTFKNTPRLISLSRLPTLNTLPPPHRHIMYRVQRFNNTSVIILQVNTC